MASGTTNVIIPVNSCYNRRSTRKRMAIEMNREDAIKHYLCNFIYDDFKYDLYKLAIDLGEDVVIYDFTGGFYCAIVCGAMKGCFTVRKSYKNIYDIKGIAREVYDTDVKHYITIILSEINTNNMLP